MHYGRESTYYHHVHLDTLVGSINCLETLQNSMWEENHDVVPRTLLDLGSHFKENYFAAFMQEAIVSCVPLPAGPQSACRYTWWRPSLCSCSLSQGDYLLPLGKKQMWELIHSLTLMDYSVMKMWHSGEHSADFLHLLAYVPWTSYFSQYF